jgi:hypothetical protein
MKKPEMRVSFYDVDLKAKLEEVAAAADLSLNELVNKILAAQFSDREKKALQLLHDLLEFKRSEEDGSSVGLMA